MSSPANRTIKVDIQWRGPTQIRLKVDDLSIQLSRLQVGVLSLFSFLSEVSREDMYEYLAKIWGKDITRPINKKYRMTMWRLLKRLKEHGLIIEHEQKFYRTMRGQAVWMAIAPGLPGAPNLISL
jgi:hypothetical protein